MDTSDLQLWLASVIKGLVPNPEDVNIVETADEQGILFTVTVHSEDRGKVIGKQGKIANAIRVVLRSAGMLNNIRASMKIDAGTDFAIKQEER